VSGGNGSALVHLQEFRALGEVISQSAEEIVVEGRWTMPSIVVAPVHGTPDECVCSIQEISKQADGSYRYKFRVIHSPAAHS